MRSTPLRAGTLAAAAAVWLVCAWLLARTSVPSLDLSGFDPRKYFSVHELARAHSYWRGEEAIWALGTFTKLAALVLLAWRLPRSVRGIGLGPIGSAIVAGMVLLVTLWFASLPFAVVDLWWQHHWGLAPFDVASWLAAQWSTLGSEAVFGMLTIVIVVGLAVRLGSRWWLAAAPVFTAIAALFVFTSGWLGSAGTHRVAAPWLRGDIARLERTEHVRGTPVSVQDVSSWTNEANAFTIGFGPSARVVVWDTLLDGRFTRGEVDVVVAHELGHVRSRHLVKSIGWSALLAFPGAFLIAAATRRRGGLANPANLPFALLVLTLASLLFAPVQNAVVRRYEAEADWRALNATRDPASARKLFESFETTSLEEPSPPTWDYLWLEDHPTLIQRIAMAELWRRRNR